MSHSFRILYQMVKADFLERVRRYSFLMTLAGALYLAYAVMTEKLRILVGDGYRGVYNSAWIGMSMAICCSTFLSLFGFYVVKNCVERDSMTRVGRILAATPMRKAFYTIAKTLSNFAVLASMVLVLMAAAVLMQWLRPEAGPISMWQLWSPFLLIALPAMIFTGSVALLFETVPGLRGGVGNVIYFFVWTAIVVAGVQAGIDDPAGIHILSSDTQQALRAMNPADTLNRGFSLTIGGRQASRTFLWTGVHWTSRLLLWRLEWIGLALALALLASLFFHRFDPAREKLSEKKPERRPVKPMTDDTQVRIQLEDKIEGAKGMHVSLTPLAGRNHNRFGRLVFSELSLMIKGLRWWWYTVAAGLLVAEFASPTLEAREGVLLAAWIWPALVWSQIGSRESRHSTESLIFSAERIAYRQLLAVWTAGVMIALVTGAGTGIRLLFSVNLPMLTAWFAGALFIPSLALASGVWSNSSKLFEAIYTVWWYIGPLHQLPGLDFIGASTESRSPGLYLGLTAGLLFASCLGRRRQLAYA